MNWKKALAEIWSEVLELETGGEGNRGIGIDDNFFRMGGHSLKTTMLARKILNRFNLVVPLVDIFERQTIRGQAQLIRARQQEAVLNTGMPEYLDERLVTLKQIQGGTGVGNLFFIHDGSGEVEAYTAFVNLLKTPFNCWGIRAAGDGETTVTDLARDYIELIRQVQPEGPYYILGWSIGGTIAFEMARQLEAETQTLNFLALVDTAPPANNSGGDIDLKRLKELLPGVKIDLETVRALDRARNGYKPESLLENDLYFFKASFSQLLPTGWNNYTNGNVHIHEIRGDHHSLFMPPGLDQFALTVDGIVRSMLHEFQF